jgi:hypothetical protein
MIFDLTALHLGDVLLALPAMRAGDAVIARPEHRVPGAPVEWLDSGRATVSPRLGSAHETAAWLAACGRAAAGHRLLPAMRRELLVFAPAVRLGSKRWSGFAALGAARPDAVWVGGDSGRDEWMRTLNRAHTVVCPDTGTAHMADALGVPRVIALHGMGRAHFERYHPYWSRGAHCVVRDSMSAISVGDVLERLDG